MRKGLGFYYWILIFFLQVYLLQQKMQTEDFYLWNIVALAASVIFIYSRIRKNKILISAEMIIALFIAVNGIAILIGQVMSLSSISILIASIIIAMLSFLVTFTIWKNK